MSKISNILNLNEDWAALATQFNHTYKIYENPTSVEIHKLLIDSQVADNVPIRFIADPDKISIYVFLSECTHILANSKLKDQGLITQVYSINSFNGIYYGEAYIENHTLIYDKSIILKSLFFNIKNNRYRQLTMNINKYINQFKFISNFIDDYEEVSELYKIREYLRSK